MLNDCNGVLCDHAPCSFQFQCSNCTVVYRTSSETREGSFCFHSEFPRGGNTCLMSNYVSSFKKEQINHDQVRDEFY